MKYIIKETATATEQNKKYAGKTIVTYFTKGNRYTQDLSWAKRYEGYSSRGYAEHYATMMQKNNNNPMWAYQYEVIENE